MNDNRLPCNLLARAALGLFVVGLALFLAVSGCVGGGMCIRNTDCGAGSYCIKQECVRHAVVEPDSGIDGGVDSDAAATSGGATANDTTDTGGSVATGGAATAGSAGTSGSAGTAGSAGTSGSAGTAGSAGTSGSAGAAGSAGTSGGSSGGV